MAGHRDGRLRVGDPKCSNLGGKRGRRLRVYCCSMLGIRVWREHRGGSRRRRTLGIVGQDGHENLRRYCEMVGARGCSTITLSFPFIIPSRFLYAKTILSSLGISRILHRISVRGWACQALAPVSCLLVCQLYPPILIFCL
jgi:hypothetical protein